MAIQLFTFEKGINKRKENPIRLDEDELQSCSGLQFGKEGMLECRPTRTAVNPTPLGSIHNIHRYMNWVLVGDDYNVRYKWDLNGYCNQYTPADDEFTSVGSLSSDRRLSLTDYWKFTFLVNGRDKKAFTHGNLYEWGIANPSGAPAGTKGDENESYVAAGTYSLYYTFQVMFPNGHIAETGPSPAGSVTLDAAAEIDWTGIQPSNYSGTGCRIWRNLYRTVSGTTYFVDSIKNNTDTTYTDIKSAITTNALLGTSTYEGPPDGFVDVEWYLQRVFGIKGEKIYWSEPYLPFAFATASNLAASSKGDDLVAVANWGDQLFMPTQTTWYRLVGSDATTWEIKRSFTDMGIINRHTMQKTKYGILGFWYEGICLFDGSTSINITEKQLGKSFFEDIVTSESGILSSPCHAHFDGTKYYFYYPEDGESTLTQCLVLDFAMYPSIKMYHDDFIATAHEYHRPTGIRYLGKSNGYQYEEAGEDETISTSLQTGDSVFTDIIHQKNPMYLYYDLDSDGKDVTVTIYVDGSSAQTITLNVDEREKKRMKLLQKDGYRIGLGISCSDSQGLKIYSPWAIDATPFGD